MRLHFKSFLQALAAILICEAAGILGSFFTAGSISGWYAGINKPFFNPPNWIFAPVWTILFALMGVSLYLVWRERGEKPGVYSALRLFGVQLILNMAWTFIFFGARSLFWAYIEIVALWFFILWTILAFRRINKMAGYLLWPYIIWVSFAAILNFSIWQLN